MSTTSTVDTIRAGLQALVSPGSVFEVRIPKYKYKSRTEAGYFDSIDHAAQAIARYDTQKETKGIYVTLNPCDPSLLARACNRIEPNMETTTNDSQIARRTRFLIDCDPVRASGISSTDAQFQAAQERAEAVQAWLTAAGWPEPLVAESGNGAHRIYGLDLPNDEEHTILLQRCLQAVAARFNDDIVTIDTGVFNAARISKVYGTMTRKGDSTTDRPHRRSVLITVPSPFEPVPLALLQQLADQAPQPEPKAKPLNGVHLNGARPPTGPLQGGAAFVEAFLSKHQIGINKEKQQAYGTVYRLDSCPFCGESDNAAVITVRNNDAISYSCKHNRCQGKTWPDFREHFEPGCYDRPMVALPVQTARPTTVFPASHNHDTQTISSAQLWEWFHQDEAGDAQLFAHIHRGRLLYDLTQKEWYRFIGPHWESLQSIPPYRSVWGQVAAVYLAEAARLTEAAGAIPESTPLDDSDDAKRKKELAGQVDALTKRAKALRKKDRIMNVLKIATEPLQFQGGQWDSDPYLLGVANGVIDLRTGILRDGVPEDYIRTISQTRWKGLQEPAPRWEQFLNEIMCGETERVNFIHRLLGYSLNGTTSEHIMVLLFGERGRNGKRVLCETVSKVLGKHAKTVPTDTVVGDNRKRAAGSAQPHLATLQGVRFAVCSETDEWAELNAAQVKNITGGDEITARELFARLTSFMPSHTLFLQTNYKPRATADDDALWDRVKVIEFRARFVDEPKAPDEHKRDRNLETTLQAEASGILAWLVQGHLDWLKGGLQTPNSVKLAREKYRIEQGIEPFIEACCVIGSDKEAEASALYTAYTTWCKAIDIKPMNIQRFGRLATKQWEKDRIPGGRVLYTGVGLREESDWAIRNPSHSSEILQSAPESQILTSESEGREGYTPVCNSSSCLQPHEGTPMQNPSYPSYPSRFPSSARGNGHSNHISHDYTGPAIWHAKESDEPVHVLGYLGRGNDGREYVQIDGSTSGIPIDEVFLPAPDPIAASAVDLQPAHSDMAADFWDELAAEEARSGMLLGGADEY